MGNVCSSNPPLPTIEADVEGNRCCNPKLFKSSCCENDTILCCVTVQKETFDNIIERIAMQNAAIIVINAARA